MADDLFRVFKSVRKLVREKTEDLFGNVTPLERTLREITDEETCAVSNSLLRHIAITTNDAYAYSVVAQAVWQGLSSEFWQRIYKCLCLLEYMILLGPERCRQDCANAQITIRSLTQYRFHDGRREQGGGVRQRAENILKLVNDAEYWRSMKEQAIQDSEKYAGGIENQPYISPVSYMNIHTRATNPFFTGPDALPPFALRQKETGSAFDPPTTIYNRPPLLPTGRPVAPASSNTAGLYDPGEDFNTSNPFADLRTAPADPAPVSMTPAVPAGGGGVSADRPQAAVTSLLDDDIFTGAQPVVTAPPKTLPASQSLLPDLLE